MNWRETILENLNPPQQQAVEQTEGPLLLLAGAGSGKTNTIVHRIAYLIHEKQVPPWKIIAVTFTNKAALEMAERTLNIAGPIAADCLIRTYHSLGLYLLRRYAHYIDYPSNFTIWDDTDQRGALQNILNNNYNEKFNKTQVRYFAQSISSFKDSLIAPHQLADEVDFDTYEYGDILPDVYQAYEISKFQSTAMDFADLLYQAVMIFKDHGEALAKLHRKYAYFLVDEYQDTNHAQYSLIQLLSQASKNLCVVGDDDQAIYGWRGANVSNILEFNKDFPEAKIIKLEENYRSTQPILNTANSIIENNLERMPKTLFTQKKEGPQPKLLTLGSDFDEARAIATIIDAMRGSVDLSEIGVLYRTNGQSRLIEEALLNMNLPYRVYGGVSFFGRKEIKDALAYLNFFTNPFDEVSFLRLVNTPSRGIGEKSIQKIYLHRNQMIEETGGKVDFLSLMQDTDALEISTKAKNNLTSLAEMLLDFSEKVKKNVDFGLLFADFLAASGLATMYEEEDRLLGTSRIENLNELKTSMLNFQEQNAEALLSDYLQEISLFASTQDTETDFKGINLMTVHNAKGLEFEIVFVVGLDDDIFPHYLSKREGSLDEERRLLYVAITRAKQKLYLTRAMRRFNQGQTQATRPSPFIAEIPENQIEMQNQQGSTRANPYPTNRPKSTYRQSGNAKPATSSKNSEFKNLINTTVDSKDMKFKPGDKINHPSFGVGRVLRLEGSGDATKIHIFFDDKKTRKFLLKYTKLEIA